MAFVGPTGSGKTTTVDLILGLLDPTSGEILIDGIPLTNGNKTNWQENLGYVPQQIFLSDDTVTHNIAFGIPEHKIDYQAVELARTAGSMILLSMNFPMLPDDRRRTRNTPFRGPTATNWYC